MAAPGIPFNFNVQQGNGEVFLSWNLSTGATSYSIQRSTDGVNFSSLATVTPNQYLDASVTVGTQYFYQVASTNGSGTSAYTSAQSTVPTFSGQKSLGEIRLMAQQRADRVNSQFVTLTEWNNFINQSLYELYDLLITVYEDYYLADPFIFQTVGDQYLYPLPNGTLTDINGVVGRPFYKIWGMDLGLSQGANAWVTLHKFDAIQRNRYIYPQLTSSALGVWGLSYRIVDNNIYFTPTPSGAQFVKLWYIPRLRTLLKDNDILESFSGWDQYVIIRAAKYALDKEESDTSTLTQEIVYLKQRIEESAMNRDVGQPDTISPTRMRSQLWGGYGFGPNGDGGSGGW